MAEYYEIYMQAEKLFDQAKNLYQTQFCQESFPYFAKAVEGKQEFIYKEWVEAVNWLADQKKGDERKELLLECVRILEMEKDKLGICDKATLGEAWEALGDLDDSISCYEKAIQLYQKNLEEYPKFSLMLLWLGDCNRKIGRLLSDESYLEKAMQYFEQYKENLIFYEDKKKESAPVNFLMEKAKLDIALVREKNIQKKYILQRIFAKEIFCYLKDILPMYYVSENATFYKKDKRLDYDLEYNREWEVLREDPYYKKVSYKVRWGVKKKIEDGMRAPLQVKTLDLSGGNFRKKEMSTDVGQFENLEELILDYNQMLDGLPEAFRSLQKLTKVSARYCRHCILEDLALLPNLKVLDATGMIFGFLQEDKEKNMRKLLGLKNLEELYLNAVDLTALPEYFEELSDLKVLSLEQNLIKEFPTVILKLRKLKKLSIWRNNLTKLPLECWKLPDLKELYLGFNKFDGELKVEMDEIYQEIMSKKPDFLTDYEGDVPPTFAFETAIDRRIKELGVDYSEFMPRYELEFFMYERNHFLPLTMTQILFGYSWEGKRFSLSEEGKRKLTLLPMEEPIVEFTNALILSQSEYFKSYYPSVYIGCLSIKRKKTKILMVLKEDGRLQRDLTNPDICLEITKKSGYKIIDFVEFLSYLVPIAEPIEESNNGKGKKSLSEQTKEETDREFSQLINSFVDAMKEDGDKQMALIWSFNKRCNKFFRNHPEASIASVAVGLSQLGIPYESAIGDVTWARSLGTRAKKDS